MRTSCGCGRTRCSTASLAGLPSSRLERPPEGRAPPAGGRPAAEAPSSPCLARPVSSALRTGVHPPTRDLHEVALPARDGREHAAAQHEVQHDAVAVLAQQAQEPGPRRALQRRGVRVGPQAREARHAGARRRRRVLLLLLLLLRGQVARVRSREAVAEQVRRPGGVAVDAGEEVGDGEVDDLDGSART